MDGGHVAWLAFDAHGFAGEEQGVRHRHAKRLPGIWDRLIRECRVAAAAVTIVVPDSPLRTHEEIADPLRAEHVDKLVEDRLRRVGMVSETVGCVAPHEV